MAHARRVVSFMVQAPQERNAYESDVTARVRDAGLSPVAGFVKVI
jgi:hypothetical protein